MNAKARQPTAPLPEPLPPCFPAPAGAAAAAGNTGATWCGQLLISLHQFAEALGEAVDVKDRYTRRHSVVVAELAQQLAVAMGLPPVRCEEIHVAGHLHDLGKIGLADRVLQATGPLSQDDWQEIRRHPVLGYEILRHVPVLAQPGGIAEMVLYHHERYDGSGYPFGLRQREIPLGARIIAVADAFSAMVDDRVYRKGLAVTQVLAELERCAGSQFDPEVIAALLAHRATICGGRQALPQQGLPVAPAAGSGVARPHN